MGRKSLHRERTKHLTTIIAGSLLLLFQALLFSVGMYYAYPQHVQHPYICKQTLAMVGIYLIFIVAFTKMLDGYKMGHYKITDVCASQIIALLLANTLEYFQLCLVFHGFISVFPIVLLSIVEIIVAVVGVVIFRRIYLHLYPAHQMLLVYGERIQNELVDKFDTRTDQYRIDNQISIMENSYEEVCEEIIKYNTILIGDISAELRNDILKFCYSNSIRTYVTPKISDILIGGQDKIHLFDTPLLLGRNYGLKTEQAICKRLFDIICSAILIIILSWLIALIALLIKIEDGGTVFFKQKRITLDRKVFTIIKFRSMTPYRGYDENRVTKVGAVLRKTHLDEIPQLFNIFTGDMSFVGPRALVEKDYDNEIEEFSFRYKVKAGLTGYAQVYGNHNTSDYDKLKLDLFYISNYSFLLDLKIMFMTVKMFFKLDEGELVEHSKEND